MTLASIALENGISEMHIHFLILRSTNVLREEKRIVGELLWHIFFCFTGEKKMYEIECKGLLDFIFADVEWVQGKSRGMQYEGQKHIHCAMATITQHTLVMHWKQLKCNNAIQRPSWAGFYPHYSWNRQSGTCTNAMWIQIFSLISTPEKNTFSIRTTCNENKLMVK